MGGMGHFWVQNQTFELFSKSVHKMFFEIVPDDRHFKAV